ncbi:MAG: hypothetical protein KJ952_06395 [Candidatus Omnitrophica bacterium]|nr:hypothetical protein [Candidatus Omnitrophota bacterium]
MKYATLLLLLTLSIPLSYIASSPAYSDELSDAFMEQQETGNGVCVHKKSALHRSDFSLNIERFSRDGKVFYEFTEHGKGDYGKYEDVMWDITAEMEEQEGLLYTNFSVRIIRDRDNNILIKYEKKFDYDKGKIYYAATDGEGNIIKKKTFPIKGVTADNNIMTHFLKAFVAHRGEKKYRSFYLISSEPKLYRINIKIIGSEVLELPRGQVEAIKLRLIPDLGLLTGLSGAVIPPTFIWYTEESPYVWLQYEGLETGLGSAHILVYITS